MGGDEPRQEALEEVSAGIHGATPRAGGRASVHDIAEAYRALRAGRATVSLGLLARVTADDRFVVGDTATGLGDRVLVTVEVYGPSWTYADGVRVREASVESTSDPRKARVAWELPRLGHDVYLVVVASGPGVTDPSWAIAKPYQPTSRT